MAYESSDLIGDLLTLIDKRWVSVHDIQQLLVAMEITDPVLSIYCLRELKRIIRLLPLQVFSDEEQRDNLVSVCQMAMDQAVDDEETSLRDVAEERNGSV
ncbi:TyeA family type III secretion system gatekeeper subunit [Pseudomonas sp. MWU13-3659]|uniref:TyeA family type III secretion system gatekeeper subunit n=1 Tax=Pseudomonas sp. MWU13-3659 TaxID=2986964 RepID=UPI002074BB64